jgi:hypothetical protein
MNSHPIVSLDYIFVILSNPEVNDNSFCCPTTAASSTTNRFIDVCANESVIAESEAVAAEDWSVLGVALRCWADWTMPPCVERSASRMHAFLVLLQSDVSVFCLPYPLEVRTECENLCFHLKEEGRDGEVIDLIRV